MQVNWRAALTQDAGEAASPLERGESDGVGGGDVDALDHRLLPSTAALDHGV
jgi:hypothetical protein